MKPATVIFICPSDCCHVSEQEDLVICPIESGPGGGAQRPDSNSRSGPRITPKFLKVIPDKKAGPSITITLHPKPQ